VNYIQYFIHINRSFDGADENLTLHFLAPFLSRSAFSFSSTSRLRRASSLRLASALRCAAAAMFTSKALVSSASAAASKERDGEW